MSPGDDSKGAKKTPKPASRPAKGRDSYRDLSTPPPEIRERPTGRIEKISDDAAVDRTLTPPPAKSDGDS